MRLLETSTLKFAEFYDSDIPDYAILSHRWGDVSQEVSYNDYVAGQKEETTGYDKIIRFCDLAKSRGFSHAWIDTCCIDKTSSAELSEAINLMFRWYERARVCFAYVSDVNDLSELARSEWHERGWTLQELVAPKCVLFFDRHWREMGSRYDLRNVIAQPSGVDLDFLAGSYPLGSYSVAQIMSWASHRKTSRLEDEAYCLMGLFGVNMPLLYGERTDAFRRLQETIMASSDDQSLFAWSLGRIQTPSMVGPFHGLLAPSPRHFKDSSNVLRGFPTRRILFELTNRGSRIVIHRSYNTDVLELLLRPVSGEGSLTSMGLTSVGLTLPLGCCIERKYSELGICTACHSPNGCGCSVVDPCMLTLILDRGHWRRVAVTSISHAEPSSWADSGEGLFVAYNNYYVRIEIDHERGLEAGASSTEIAWDIDPLGPEIKWYHVRHDYQSRKQN